MLSFCDGLVIHQFDFEPVLVDISGVHSVEQLGIKAIVVMTEYFIFCRALI